MQGSESRSSLQGDMDRLLQRMANAHAAKLVSFAYTDVIDLATTSAESSPRDSSEELPSRAPMQPVELSLVEESAAKSPRQDLTGDAILGAKPHLPVPALELQRKSHQPTECRAVPVVQLTEDLTSGSRHEHEECKSKRSPERAGLQAVFATQQSRGLSDRSCDGPQELERSPKRVENQVAPIAEHAGGLPDGYWDELQYGGISPDCSSSGAQQSLSSRGGLEATAFSPPAGSESMYAMHSDLARILECSACLAATATLIVRCCFGQAQVHFKLADYKH